MREDRAKKQLATMLRTLTPGSVLHLLAEILRDSAEEAGQGNDNMAKEQYTMAEHTLIVVGIGIDAICPR